MLTWGHCSGHFFHSVLALGLLVGLPLGAVAQPAPAKPATFGEDVAFLKKYVEVVVLSDAAGQAKVAVVPAWQGRVMTSTAGGDDGQSFGWINRELIASGKLSPQFNAFGGEDRFWLGPEGGQFGFYFKKGDPFDIAHWQVPALIDTEPFPVVPLLDTEPIPKGVNALPSAAPSSVRFEKQASLDNYSGTRFDLKIGRTIKVYGAASIADGHNLPGLTPDSKVKAVTFISQNTLFNVGRDAWTKETGLPSIWILGMFNPSPSATIVLPFKKGSVDELGPVVNDAYFGKVPADRLKVGDGVIFFKADGTQRGKIGLSPRRATQYAGAYDAASKTLTIVQYLNPEGGKDFVNSMWEIQKDPFSGDVVNAYNDGPTTPGGKPLGPFFEVEASSPGAALSPQKMITHMHVTIHIQGEPAELDKIAKATLGASLAEIEGAFGK